MKYAPPVGGAVNDPYIDANPAGGIEGSPVPAAAIEHPMREIVNAIKDAGLTEDDADMHQLSKAIQSGGSNLAIAAGTSDAITAAFTPPIAALTNGLMVCVKASAANSTATPTLKVDGTAVTGIVKGDNRSLELGDIPGAGYWANFQYNQTLGKWVMLNPARGLSSGQVGEIFWVASNKAPTGAFKANGATPSRAAYPALFAYLVKSSTATISIASPGVVTWNGHGLSANDPVKFTTTGALPTGLVAGTTYYVVGASITTNTFQLSATAGGAAINTSGAQSGVHTAINAPFGDGDGSTTFTLPDMRDEFPRGWDDGRGGDPNRVFGSAQIGQNKSHYHEMWGNAQYNGVTLTGGAVAPYAGGAIGAGMYTGAEGGTEARPRNIALLACIRY